MSVWLLKNEKQFLQISQHKNRFSGAEPLKTQTKIKERWCMCRIVTPAKIFQETWWKIHFIVLTLNSLHEKISDIIHVSFWTKGNDNINGKTQYGNCISSVKCLQVLDN